MISGYSLHHKRWSLCRFSFPNKYSSGTSWRVCSGVSLWELSFLWYRQYRSLSPAHTNTHKHMQSWAHKNSFTDCRIKQLEHDAQDCEERKALTVSMYIYTFIRVLDVQALALSSSEVMLYASTFQGIMGRICTAQKWELIKKP